MGPSSEDTVRPSRDLFIYGIACAGLLAAVITAALLPEQATNAPLAWTRLSTAVGAAVTATLAVNLIAETIRRRRLAVLLARLALLGLNAALFVAQLILLVELETRR